ncbi:uncharacterized protein LOC109709313 [Ananas comosus]|uniref:Uncharacterized protein LOC109709313 n=1 Tax=Ananas comosus TaxID=4615 RepID=A0A6P5ETK7_ANACO|nr:uncharacterized protein LOC109709313 [Ananas comosus]XP_020087071.1 uncharacterized protein LOC109709313 [Ananas comosus]XP_020087072.1 uncharacterized protein LOC109709313 [Ananas comosus]XP_020087073.1 uncharacterized protein LOC109709313 [Ananas comosus]XP_020087074.1 uncharacterized protein LOC109709313 [Ananas comosus]
MAKRKLKVCSVEDDQGQPREEPSTQHPTQPQVSLSSHQPNATSHIAVDDVDQIVDTEVEICVEDSSGSRKTRGVTRMSDVWNLPPEMRIFVKFNSFYQPVDTEGSVLHRFMGTIVRKPNLLPIDCFNWRKMDAKYKEYCWKILESKFSFPKDPRDSRTSEMIQRITMKKLGDLWRNFKCELKSKYFDESLQKNAILMKAPASVNRAQFNNLVDFWFSNEGKERSRKNRHNRDQQMDFYAAGSKSIAQYAYNMEKNGVVPTRGKLYVVHHKKKNGEPVTELAKNRIEKLEPLNQKEVDVSQTGSSRGSLMWAATDAYAEVIGKERHGRVRGVGFGPTPSMLGASSINTSQRLRMVPEEEILRDKEEIRDLKDRLKFIEEKVAFLLSQQSNICSSQVEKIAEDIILERSSASENSRDGKGTSVLEQQGVQATEAAQPRKRRRYRLGKVHGFSLGVSTDDCRRTLN